jgi:hypothetical protein
MSQPQGEEASLVSPMGCEANIRKIKHPNEIKGEEDAYTGINHHND